VSLPGEAAADPGSLPRDLLVEALSRSPVLSRCSRQDLARLLPFLRERRLEPGEALYSAGQPAGDMWLVCRGTLRLTRADDSSEEIADGLVGEEAALGLGSYLSDVVAVEAATVVAVGRDVVPAELRGSHPRGQAFYRSLIDVFAPARVTAVEAGAAAERLTLAFAGWKLLGWIGAVVSPVVMLYLFQGTALRWEQQQLAAVLVSSAMLWVFRAVPPYVAGLLVVLVCVTLGIVPTPVVLSGFASNAFFLALSIFCIGAVLIESGMIVRAFLLLVKHCPRSAFWYDMTAVLSGLLLTPIVPSAPDRARVLAPLAMETAQTLGYRHGSRDSMRLALATFMGLSLFSPMFVTGGALNLVLYGSLPEQVQDAIPAARWVVAALAAALVLLAAFLVAYAVAFRRPAAPRDPRQTIDAQLAVLGPVRPAEWVAIGGVLLFLGAIASVSAHKIDHRLLALAIVCGYLVLGTLGEEQLNLRIDWSMLLLLGTLIGLVETIVYVDLHSVIAAQLPWLSQIMKYDSRLFVAILAVVVVFGRLWIPRAGALAALYAVPLALVNGMSPWVVVFVILVANDAWVFPYQSEVFRTFRDAVRTAMPFDDRLVRRFTTAMAIARLVALAVSVLYWEHLVVL
jgi:DASS family divalent anion:Na+ symporter